MPRIPRFRRKQDPRQPPQSIEEATTEAPETAKPYGQWLEPEDEQDDLKEFEDTTDEVAREESDGYGNAQRGSGERPKEDIEEREDFEDLTGEVSREGDEKS